MIPRSNLRGPIESAESADYAFLVDTVQVFKSYFQALDERFLLLCAAIHGDRSASYWACRLLPGCRIDLADNASFFL